MENNIGTKNKTMQTGDLKFCLRAGSNKRTRREEININLKNLTHNNTPKSKQIEEQIKADMKLLHIIMDYLSIITV